MSAVQYSSVKDTGDLDDAVDGPGCRRGHAIMAGHEQTHDIPSKYRRSIDLPSALDGGDVMAAEGVLFAFEDVVVERGGVRALDGFTAVVP